MVDSVDEGREHPQQPRVSAQPAQSAPRRRGWSGWVLAAAIVAILWAIGKIAGQSSSQDAAPASDTAVTAVTVTTPSGKNLPAASVDGVLYGIDKTSTSASLGKQSDFSNATTAHGAFIVLRVYADNRSDKPHDVSLHRAELVGGDGKKYSASFDGEFALQETGDSESLGTNDDLNPGLHRYTKIVFDVPADRTNFTLDIPPALFSGDNDGMLPIAVAP